MYISYLQLYEIRMMLRIVQRVYKFDVILRGDNSAQCGPGNVVGIATAYGLGGLGIESRLGGGRFSAPVQTGPEAHPASCKMDTGSFPGVSCGRDVTLTRHPF
jgi:hypothetical protein